MAQLNDLIVTGSSRLLSDTNTGAITASGMLTPNGGVSFTGDTALPQFSGSPSFYLGIEGFSSGGRVKWQNASSCSVGYATSAGSAAPTSGSTNYIQNNVGSSRATTTSGSWMSMVNSSAGGSPVTPTAGWWTVLSADCWNSAPYNWVSQLALPTQDTSGVWWRRNDSGSTSIDSSAWRRLAEGDSNGNASVANKLGTSTVGGTTTPIYLNAGTPTALSYTLAKSVPSDAVFTDHYAWSDITGKPITLAANSSALNTNGWKTLGGRSSGDKLTVSYASSSPATWNSEAYSATVLFGAQDTKGFLDCGYNTPIVTFGGGSVGNSTDDNPKWYWKFSGTSGKTYTLPSDSCTLGTSNLALGTTSTTALKGDTKYAGSSSAGGSATSAVKLDTATAGSATQPCYFTGGQPSACTYSLNKTVPSDAVFTDTNNAVTQTATTTNADYEVLFSATADNTTRTEGARKSTHLTFNPNSDYCELRVSNNTNVTIRLNGHDGKVSANYVDAGNISCSSMTVEDVSSRYSFSKTSGNWTYQGIRAVRCGNVVAMQIIIKGGTSVSAGSNALVGTLSGGPLPARVDNGTQDSSTSGVNFYGTSALVGTLTSSGIFTLRLLIAAQSLGTNTTSMYFTFVCD